MNVNQLTERILILMESHGFTTDFDGAADQLRSDIKTEIEIHLAESDYYNLIDHEYLSKPTPNEGPF